MICIVSGPSSAGKSAILTNSKCLAELTDLSPSSPVVFPASMSNAPAVFKKDCFFHYNILRYADYLNRHPLRKFSSYTKFVSDSSWKKILTLSYPKKAIVMVVPRSVLLHRIPLRKQVEPKKLKGNSSVSYPNSYWMNLLERVDLEKLYLAWCVELENKGIPYTLIDSSNESYLIIKKDQIKHLVLNQS